MPLFKYYLTKQINSARIDIYPAELSAFLMPEIPIANAEFDLIIADVSASTCIEAGFTGINASIFATTYNYASCEVNIYPADITCSLFSENKINAFIEMHNAEIYADHGVCAFIQAIHASMNCTFIETQICSAFISMHNADINITAYSENYISAEINMLNASISASTNKPSNEVNAFIQMHNAGLKANLFSVISATPGATDDVVIKFEEMAEVI